MRSSPLELSKLYSISLLGAFAGSFSLTGASMAYEGLVLLASPRLPSLSLAAQALLTA